LTSFVIDMYFPIVTIFYILFFILLFVKPNQVSNEN
jgi:hypothetical protein